MSTKQKRKPRLSKKAQQQIVTAYTPVRRELTPEEKAKAYADMQALYETR